MNLIMDSESMSSYHYSYTEVYSQEDMDDVLILLRECASKLKLVDTKNEYTKLIEKISIYEFTSETV